MSETRTTRLPLMAAKQILVVEDEKPIRDMIGFGLRRAGFEVREAADTQAARAQLADKRPDLMLVDWMLPDMSGLEFTRQVKRDVNFRDLPVIMLTARAEESDKVAGLEGGADDYITKPIRPRLLISKIESLLRRIDQKKLDGGSSINKLVIDREKFVIELNGNEILLPKKEFELLELLASRPGKVYNRDQILSIVWGNDTVVGERTIDVHIRKLREKLGDDYIRTVKGVGYTFNIM